MRKIRDEGIEHHVGISWSHQSGTRGKGTVKISILHFPLPAGKHSYDNAISEAMVVGARLSI